MKNKTSVTEHFQKLRYEAKPICPIEELPTDHYHITIECDADNNHVSICTGYDDTEEYDNMLFLSIEDAKNLQKGFGAVIRNYYHHLTETTEVYDYIKDTVTPLCNNGEVEKIVIDIQDMDTNTFSYQLGRLSLVLWVTYKTSYTKSYTLFTKESYHTKLPSFFIDLETRCKEQWPNTNFIIDENKNFPRLVGKAKYNAEKNKLSIKVEDSSNIDKYLKIYE